MDVEDPRPGPQRGAEVLIQMKEVDSLDFKGMLLMGFCLETISWPTPIKTSGYADMHAKKIMYLSTITTTAK